MKAYIISTKTIIEPFGDLVKDTLILDIPFEESLQKLLKSRGFSCEIVEAEPAKVNDLEPFLVLKDYLFITSRLLDEFLLKIGNFADGSAKRLGIKKGLFTRLLAPLQETEQDEESILMPLWYFPPGKTEINFADIEEIETTEKILIDPDEDSYEGNFPKHMLRKEGYKFCVTSRAAICVTHPLHLALANMAANFARLAEQKRTSVLQKLMVLLKARSFSKFRILSAISSIHPEAEVHPTAVIEGSVIGKGAKIGAYAVVKFSYIGENVFVDDHAGIKFSVLGKGSYVANNCVVFFCVVYPGAFLISGPYQFTLFGYDSAIMNSIPADYKLDGGTISVKTRKGIEDTGLRFVGSVIGHRTKIAAGVIIAPGRVIPNDLFIYPDPARVIQKIPENLPKGKPVFLIDGELISGENLFKKKRT
ncbi:MAG: hypothetical protein HQM08_11000 [Candidatus Riflebacteria bacterium]|nr:hypothetical protein [Candidatus Riflebacteria bacterium]